jgi:hypothetical protein
MNETVKAVIIEVTGGNVRNHHINLRGAFGLFPDDCLGGNSHAVAGKPVTIRVGGESIETDIDETKAIFREPGAIRRFFESNDVAEGDLVAIERLGDREYHLRPQNVASNITYDCWGRACPS